MSDQIYEQWLEDYRIRREGLRREVMGIGQEAFEIDARSGMKGNWCSEEARRYAAERREGMVHKFCLLLWSQHFDEAYAREVLKGENVDLEEARRLLSQKAVNFLPRIGRVTVRLDLAGLYSLMVWPEGKSNPPPQPVVIEVPEIYTPPDDVNPGRDMNAWFYFFTIMVELAQAIVVEANYSEALGEKELKYIHKHGLGGRVLYFDVNDELYREQDTLRWPLESIGDAVNFAAAQPVG